MDVLIKQPKCLNMFLLNVLSSDIDIKEWQLEV